MTRNFTPQFSVKRTKLFLTILTTFLAGFSASAWSQNAVQTAMHHLRVNRTAFNLSYNDLNDLIVTDNYTSKQSGITYVYLRQAWKGIGIYNANLNVNITSDGEIVNYHNDAFSEIKDRVNGTTPQISASDAIAAAAAVYGLGIPQDIYQIQSPQGKDLAAVYSGGNISQEDIPVRLMYFGAQDARELRLCWDLSILTQDGQHWYSLRVDAETGVVLDEYDWMVTCNWGTPHDHDHKQHLAPGPVSATDALPRPEPLNLYARVNAPDSYQVFPEPIESPNHGTRSVIVNPANALASPFGWHDTNGAAGAEFTITRGNNVHAQEDQNGNNGTGASPNGGASLDFLFPINFTQQPNTYVDAATTNLFYWNNLMHDVWYQYGFDEVSGNFQENNYGRGGLGSDYVNADCQDGSGFNNANFGTPADGGNPRMQMFLWTGSAQTFFTVNSPAVIAGNYNAVPAGFGPAMPIAPITAPLILANDGSGNPTEACNALVNGGAMAGNIALIDRGNCTFVNKVQNAQNAGAVACVVCNNVAGAPITMGGATGGITIPSVMISQADCNLIKAQLGGGVNVSLSGSGTAVDIDGDFDNVIIAHEYGHGISNRLTGGPAAANCLGNQEQMGEGWSDYFGIVMTIEPGDQSTDRRGVGTYAIGQTTTGTGIRPAPYTTDMNINGFTYGDITNTGAISRPHGIGFLWCNMLWEMTWMLIDRYGWDPDIVNGTGGNNIAMQLVTEGMKLQGCSPGFVDGRDAILLADQNLFGGANRCLIWTAFAKRGLGFSASQGSSNNRTDGNEAFDLPGNCTPFPVAYEAITATPGDDEIIVNWTVTSEVENKGFDVERRAENEVEFRTLGFVPGKGNSNSAVEYGYLDEDVRAGILYEYRLNQLDMNGTSSYSKVVTARIQPDARFELKLYPNPSNGLVNLEIDGTVDKPIDVTVMNLMGQEVFVDFFEAEAALAPMGLDLRELPAGHYMVKVHSGDNTVLKKLVVK